MSRLFGNQLPPFSSTKGFTGHTTSASGAIELVISLLALQHQFLPVSLHWQTPFDPQYIPVTQSTPAQPLKHVLCNSFGFGGNDTSLILSLV
jgi:3-oxoacyl-(acyl-carrier-protein) synthase